jgi:hypothetical protein
MVEIYNDWDLENISKSDNKIFVFNDNLIGMGKHGDAAIRDYANAFGLKIRKGPGTKPNAFFTDKEYNDNILIISKQLIELKELELTGKVIVLNFNGYGNGTNKLSYTAPKTYEFLCNQLKGYFNFDNERGTRYNKLASHQEIESGIYISLSKKDVVRNNITQPINNSFFPKVYLESGYTTIFDLIKNEKKIAFTQNVKYNIGDILIFTFSQNEPYLVCRVINSYDISILNDSWYIFEGFDKEYVNNINIFNSKVDYYQTHFEYLSTLDTNGNMIFKDGVVNEIILDTLEETIEETIPNTDKYYDMLLSYLVDNNIKGDIEEVISDNKTWIITSTENTHILQVNRNILGYEKIKCVLKYKKELPTHK